MREGESRLMFNKYIEEKRKETVGFCGLCDVGECLDHLFLDIKTSSHLIFFLSEYGITFYLNLFSDCSSYVLFNTIHDPV